MNPQPQRPSVRVGDPAGLLAIVPHLLGFTPQTSLVVLGAGPPDGRVQVALRYDLPDPPDTGTAAQIAAHAAAVLSAEQLATVIIAGYSPGPLVTPVADATRDAVLALCARLGMGKLGVVTLDGMKITASAPEPANRTEETLVEAGRRDRRPPTPPG